ncbi:MAG TPA: pyridoxamine 5'-phosphate oxidase family protein [Acidothermaceae bacterium]|nr:pyridoxamine 5'-phosphate oxidase family protein [Acidothermaceae bacterium]
MSKVREHIDERLRTFIAAQHIYFVATAPTGPAGHVNVSPKGHADTFAILDPLRVAYLDLTGSGAETLAHIRDNGRVTIMFCAFDGPPDVVRLHGHGRIVPTADREFDTLMQHFRSRPGQRAIVVVDVERVSTSCGFAVPLYEYRGDRDLLQQWAARKSTTDLEEYHRTRNAESIDGLPALPVSPTAGAE